MCDTQIAKIVEVYRRLGTVEKYAYLARFEETKENSFNLNIPHCVNTFGDEEEIHIKAVQAEARQKLEEYSSDSDSI